MGTTLSSRIFFLFLFLFLIWNSIFFPKLFVLTKQKQKLPYRENSSLTPEKALISTKLKSSKK